MQNYPTKTSSKFSAAGNSTFKNLWKEWGVATTSGLFILLLALFLRLYNLTLLPIFADEAIYIRWAQVMRAESTLRFLPLSDGKQPFFMWLVIPFLKVFSDPLFAGRATSVISGMGTLAGIFFLSYHLFKSKRTALIASLIYATSPFSIFFDRMALVDSLLTMFGVWTFFFSVMTVKTLRLDYAMLAGFALGAALLTKSPALFFSLLLPTTWLLLNWQTPPRKRLLHLVKLAYLTAVTYLIAYGMYNILRLGPNFHLITARNQDYIFPLSHIWINPKDPFIFHLDRAFEWIRMMGSSLILVLAVLGIFTNLRKYFKEIALPLIWFLFPILIQSEFAKVFTARYILFSIPFLFILAASSLVTRTILVRRFSVVLLLILIFQALKFDYFLLSDPEKANLPRSERSGYLEEWTAGTGIAEVAEYLKEKQKEVPNQKIVVGTEGYFGTLPDGLLIYLNEVPEITVIGVGIDISETPSSLIDSKKAGNKTYLVVNSSRLKADPEELGLELVSVYPKAFRPEGIKEFLQHGPRDNLYLFEVTQEAI